MIDPKKLQMGAKARVRWTPRLGLAVLSVWVAANRRRLLWLSVIALAGAILYVAAYVSLSRHSGYEHAITRSAPQRDALGVFVTHLHQFGPYFACRVVQTNGTLELRPNFLGYLFAPLVSLDRVFVHKSFERIASPHMVASVVAGWQIGRA